MRKRIITLSVSMLMAACMLAVMLSCGDDDCPVCPDPDKKIPPYRGWVYTTSGWDKGSVYKIDAETGEPVDSVLKATNMMSGGHIDVSQDGLFLAVSHCCERDSITGENLGGYTQIYDAQTLAPIHEFPFIFVPVFAAGHNLLLGMGYDSIRTISLPDFQIIDSHPAKRIWHPVLVEEDSLIYGVIDHALDSIIAYNYVTRRIHQTWPVRNKFGDPIFLRHIDVHPNGKRVFFLGSDNVDPFGMFGCYDLPSSSLMYTYRQLFTDFGDVKVSPDGRDVYVTDPGGSLMPYPAPGTVYVFDADNGSYITGISLYGLGTYPGNPLPAFWMVFAPTGGYVYVSAGDPTKAHGTVLTIDTDERRVINLTWPELWHIPMKVVVGPKR